MNGIPLRSTWEQPIQATKIWVDTLQSYEQVGELKHPALAWTRLHMKCFSCLWFKYLGPASWHDRT